jgi:predicted nucleic acid-binding protein
MTAVFADTLYWIAIVRPGDPWQAAALQSRRSVQAEHLVTTDEVLTEFLTALASGGPVLRRRAAQTVRALLSNRDVTVLPQSRERFLQSLNQYSARLDKGYSLTDCSSMCVMRELSIRRVLTNDEHFRQEGFEILIKR